MELDRRFNTPFEVKFVGEASPGSFTGYGSVFNLKDSHKDIILPGAFSATMAEHKARGSMPSMHAMHSLYMGGDVLPIGSWKSVAEDSKGLHVEGKISGLNTDTGRRIYELMQDGALPALSIVYRVPKGGAIFSEDPSDKSGREIRTINTLKLRGIDVVDDPSNEGARIMEMRSAGFGSDFIEELKAMLTQSDSTAACDAIQKAAALHQRTTSGGNSPSAEDRAQMLAHLDAAHKAASGGKSLPISTKVRPDTIREFETFLREQFSLSNSEARSIAEGGWKSAFPGPRDEGQESARRTVAALSDLRGVLAGFSLNP
jgi:hypothetical protein